MLYSASRLCIRAAAYHAPPLAFQRTHYAATVSVDLSTTRRRCFTALKSLDNVDAPAESSKTETVRLPAGQLFEQRHYIFTTIRNIRSYEWGHKETSELLDDLLDESSKDPIRDFELQQIVLVPAKWDKTKYGLGNIYDIYDGQQRLVTMSLLYAALRDSLRSHQDQDETVQELSDMLNPPRSRKKSLLRIQLRQREGTMLSKILTPELTPNGKAVDLPSPKCRSNLTVTDHLVIQNYGFLLKNIIELSLDDKLALVDYLRESVYFLVCSTVDSGIARNIVMGQGKGKNNEPVDDFKGLVCFRAIQSEAQQEEVFEKWDELASSDAGVGRNVVAAACLLLASAQLRVRVKKNDEMATMEEWLKHELDDHYEDGREFFYKVIDPACRMLCSFRDGSMDIASLDGSKGNDKLQRSISMRLAFLRAVCQVSTAKEIEIVVLHQLLQKLSADELERRLKHVELAALCMMLLKPTSPATRHRLAFSLLDKFDTNESDIASIKDIITTDMLIKVRKALDASGFGSRSPGTTIASAILERLSAHRLCDQFQSSMPQCQQLQLEHILPKKAQGEYWTLHWPYEDSKLEWMHRLGNLAPLNQKANAKASNKPFSSKKDLYKESPYPLTSSLQNYEVWNQQSVERRHQEILHLANEVWGL